MKQTIHRFEEEELMEGLKKEFSTLNIALMAVAIAINIAVGTLVLGLKVPLYLDSIGTVLVGVLVGPWAGAATGFLANIIWAFLGNPIYAPFAGVAAIIGALAAAFARANWFKEWWKAAVAGLITGLIAALVSAPIAAYVFGGTLGAGTDAIVGMFRAAGLDALGANMAQGITSDPVDKMISFLVVWAVLQALPARFQARFGGESTPAKKAPVKKAPARKRR
jgi:energy-coupling factor transport system substrate-specific component